jgi:O-acetylserine/cysteine efflux transporter
MFAAQFAFMFLGMRLGMPAGLASLVLQFQVFVSLALSVLMLGERVRGIQVAGALVASLGFFLVARHTGSDVTVAGFICVLLAAVSWSFANVTSRRLGKVNPLALVVWGGLVVPLPMGLASLAFEGPDAILHGLTHAGATTWLSVAYTVYLSTLVAYTAWSWLLSHYPASTVTPFTLLVPVFGMLTSALWLGEALPGWKLQAAALVIAGLVLCVVAPRFIRAVPQPARS